MMLRKNHKRANLRRGRVLTRAFASVLALALGVGSIAFSAVDTAYAAPEDALTVTVVKADGTPVAPGEVVPEGTTLKLRVQYQKQNAPNDLTGTTQSIVLNNVTVNATVPGGNTAIQGFTPNSNGFDVTFNNPWPSDVDQGYFDIEFVVDAVTQTEELDIEWTAGGNSGSLTIVVKESSDVLEDIDSLQTDKAVSPSNLNSYVTVGPDVAPNDNEIIFQGLSSTVIGQPLTYTLTVALPAGTDGTGYDISDQLPPGLSYVPGSFSSTLTTWDSNGWNQQVTPLGPGTTPTAFSPSVNGTGVAGQGFAGQIDLPDPAILTITYQAVIADEASRVVVENALRAQVPPGGNSGSFTHTLTNTATFEGDPTPSTADVTLTGTIPGPCTTGCTGAAFSKDGSGASVNVIADGSGTIVNEAGDPAPVDVTYTLAANLSQWNGSNSNYTLDRNVVISDTLGAQQSWKTGDPNFITVTAAPGSPVQTLTQVACPANAASDPIATAATNFNGDGYIGNFCIDGQRLLINIGKAQATDVSIALKTQLHTVTGLSTSGTSTILGATRYHLPNQAQFWHRNGARSNANNNQYPTKLPDDRSSGLNDTSAFTKRGPSGTISVNPGDRALVPYTFRVVTSVSGVSAADAKIEDPIDTNVFDMSDLSQIGIASTYTGVGNVSGDVRLSFTGGILTVELDNASAFPPAGTWEVTLTIPTFPLVGKQTLDIHNSATLYGTGSEPRYWSEDSSRATSFGDELEVRKHVYDRDASSWTSVLVAAQDSNSELLEDVYVYRLQLIAHGSFSGAILSVSDLLPAETEFLGFVDASDVATGGPVLPSNTVALGHGIQAAFDPLALPQGEITLSQASGSMPVGGEVAAYFAVRLDRDLPELVVNSLSRSEATIIPGGPSIDIEKWTNEGSAPQYDSRGRLQNDGFRGDFDTAPGKQLTANTAERIRFTVSNDGPEPLVDIEVVDRLDSGSGTISGLQCTFPGGSTGTTWAGPFAIGAQFECEGMLAGLQAGQTHADTASVTGVGQRSGIVVDDSDAWHGHVPAAPLDRTGGQNLSWLLALGGLGIIGGGLLLARARRTEATQ